MVLEDTAVQKNEWLQVSGNRTWLEQRRLEAGAMFRSGACQSEVVGIFGVSRTTASRWGRAFEKGGLRALARRYAPGRPCRLTSDQIVDLLGFLAERPERWGLSPGRRTAWTSRIVADFIEAEFGVRYNPDHIGRLLQRYRPRADA